MTLTHNNYWGKRSVADWLYLLG